MMNSNPTMKKLFINVFSVSTLRINYVEIKIALMEVTESRMPGHQDMEQKKIGMQLHVR